MTPATIPAYIARTQFGALLKKTATERRPFIISKTGVPVAVLMSVRDFDDMVEELDPEFQKSLKAAYQDYEAGRAISLASYLEKISARR